MKKLIVVVASLWTSVAFAQVVPKDTISAQSAADMLVALTEISQGHPCEKPDLVGASMNGGAIHGPPTNCSFRIGAATIAISRDIAKLREIAGPTVEGIGRVENDVYGPDHLRPDFKPTAEQFAERNKQVEAIWQKTYPWSPDMINLSDLHVGDDAKPQIPEMTIARIMPLIDASK